MRPFYEQDGITIFNGDCRDILPTLARESVDLVLTDPPYGVNLDTSRRTSIAPAVTPHGGYRRPSHWERIAGDRTPFDPLPWLTFPRTILWGANHYADRLPPSPSWIVWDKREGTTSDTGADCEMAWTSLGGPARLYRQLWRGMIQRGEENGTARLHPTQKPVALMSWCIDRARLTHGALILDPYSGSGTTLIAAYRLGHRAIGIEVSEAYCEIAANRLRQQVLPLEAAG